MENLLLSDGAAGGDRSAAAAPGDEAAQSAALGDDELPSLEDLEKSPFGLAAFTNVTATREMHV